jgi:hypothetical protein
VDGISGREKRLEFRSLLIVLCGREWLTRTDWEGERWPVTQVISAGLSMPGIAEDVGSRTQRVRGPGEEKKSACERHRSRQIKRESR